MRHVLAGGWIGMSALATGCVSGKGELLGPLPVRNQHPAQLTQMHMAPSRAAVLPAGASIARLDSAYTSLFLLGSTDDASWTMDGEYLRVAGRWRVGLGAGLELAVELPFAHTTGGFLDSFVIGYHDALGLPDQARDSNPRNQFDIEAERDGLVVWDVERDSFELLDVPLHLTWCVREPGPDRLGIALRGGVEAPTGDDERGYGSGEFDASAGVVGELHTGAVAWYCHLQHTFAGTPPKTREAGLRFADITAAGLGAELPIASDLNLLLQFEWETSTLRELRVPAAERQQLLFWIGSRWRPAPAWAVELGFGEDLQGLASPDFTAWLGMVWLPGAAPGPRGTGLPR